METLSQIYKLPKRIKLQEINGDTIAIIKLIKSRIIQKDARKIIEIAKKIIEINPEKKVALICTENICSKSTKLLSDNHIEIIFREL